MYSLKDVQLAMDQGRDRDAWEQLQPFLTSTPKIPEAVHLAGDIMLRNRYFSHAKRFYEEDLALRPELGLTRIKLVKTLIGLHHYLQAWAMLQDIPTQTAEVEVLKSAALCGLERVDEAVASAQAALQREPLLPEAKYHLGKALLKNNQPEAALTAFAEAINQKPDYANALCELGRVFRVLGQFDNAREALDCALSHGCAEARYDLGCLALLQGDFVQGLEDYEARYPEGRTAEDVLTQRFPFPIWEGPGSGAKRVLILAERGFGDMIQFARYFKLMQDAGIELHVHANPCIHALLGPLVGERMMAKDRDATDFDAQIAVGSLLRAFGTRLETIPAHVPYLFAQERRVQKWAAEIGEGGLRIGCVWAGTSDRAFRLIDLAPIAAVEDVRLISLQRGEGERQLENALCAPTIRRILAAQGSVCEQPAEKTDLPFSILRLSANFDSYEDAFVDSAAAMMSLDLIITCDTAIAHLAGALGRPVWVALKKDADWRWLQERDTSPWYPTMRLFRQEHRGDWRGVFAAMAARLRDASLG